MNGSFENTVNEMNHVIMPLFTIVILITGILTMCYGIYKISQKYKSLGLKYIGAGIGVIDISLIIFLLLVLNDNIKNFIKTDKTIILLSLVAVMLFIVAFILVYKSQIKSKL